MAILRKIIDFYITSSIHVALSCYALVRMTGFLFQISDIEAPAFFAFFGTIVGYNFVKYDALARTQKLMMSVQLKAIAFLSLLSFFAAAYYFFELARATKIVAVLFLFLTLLYTLPFFPNKKNARNWAGVKIYIVALCWVGVTLGLPVINSRMPIATDFFLVGIQRYILIFVLVLVFEIIDLRHDDPHLKTVPQQIGVKRTKIVGSCLLVLLVLLEFLYPDFNVSALVLKAGIAGTTLLFLVFADERKSKYYSTFWVEGIPVLWWVLLLLFG